MWSRGVSRILVIVIISAILLAGVGQVEGKAPKGILRIPPKPIEPMLNEITDLLATPHQPTVNDVQLEWAEKAGAIGYNIYRSTSVRGDGFNFTLPYASVAGDGIGKIIWADAGAYADMSNYSWVVKVIYGAGEDIAVSNPAWKLMYPLISTGIYGGDLNYISLPYRMNVTSGSNVNNAAALLGDIRAYGTPANAATSVGRWNQDTSFWEKRIPIAGTNFPLTAGEGYMVVVNQNATYKIVGAHDPGVVQTFRIGTGIAGADQNFISLPYHFNIIQGTSYNLSAALLYNIRTYGIPTNGATSVGHWRADIGWWEMRTMVGGASFPLKPGECYRVIVTQVSVTWDCSVAIWGA